MGLLKRTVSSKNKEIFSMLCESLVISVLEYACPVWSPSKRMVKKKKKMRMAVSGGMLQDSCLDYRDRGDHFKLLGLKNLANTKKH